MLNKFITTMINRLKRVHVEETYSIDDAIQVKVERLRNVESIEEYVKLQRECTIMEWLQILRRM